MNAFYFADQQLGSALQAEDLYLFGSERRDAHFTNPERKVRLRTDLIQFVRPFTDLPMVPIEWESVDSNRIHLIQYMLLFHPFGERGIDGRHPT